MERVHLRPAWHIADFDSRLSAGILACLVAIVCYQADSLVFVLGIPPDHIASFWPSTAFLVVVLLLVPRKIWPVLIIAGLGAMAFADLENGVPIGFEIWITLGNLAETLVATLGIRRLLHGVPDLGSLKNLSKYLVFAVIFVPIASALVGAIGSVPGGYWLQFRLWFFADALAFLTVAPAILTWVREGREWSRKSLNYLEFAALMISLVLFGYFTFMGTGREERPALLYSLVPLLLWAALRFGLKGVSISALVVALLAMWGAAHGRGPFAEQGPLNNALSLQLFLFFAAIPFTILAVLVEEQKRAQEVLRESEQRFRLVADTAPVLIWMSGTDKLCVYFNKPWLDFTGRSLEQEKGNGWAEGVHPDDLQRCLDTYTQVFDRQEEFRMEYRLRRHDGEYRWIFDVGAPRFNADHSFAGYIGSCVDVTERRRAEKTVRESEERLRLAAHVGKMYAFDWDVATDLVVRSEEGSHILGLTGGPMSRTHQQVLASVHPDDRATFNTSIAECTPESPNTQISYRLLRPDGSVFWMERTGHAFFDEQGRMVRMIGMVADVTERKLAEEALSRVGGRLIEAHEEERSRIARDLHDDIGQRLALLVNDLDGLEKDLPDSAVEVRNRIHEQLNRVHEIASDTQAMSHQLHSSKLRLLGIVAAAKSFCQELSEQQKVEIDFTHADIPPAVPEEISLCLFRVMQEALHNAVKHSGVQRFEVELRGAPDGIHLTVRDAGLGCDPEGVKNNRGLGLVSMQERVNLVKGTFSIDSRPGRGTTIHARVPLSTRGESARAAGG